VKALVLMNMGGARNKEELEMFLRNMFNDKNILTIKSDFFRSLIASFIVYSRRNSAWENYEEIGGESPIYKHTDKLIEKLQNKLGDEYFVTQAMRYTPPMAKRTVLELEEKNINDVILFPLYPQYSTTTTKSSLEDFDEAAIHKFESRVIDPFYQDENYNTLICDEIIDELKDDNLAEYNLIFSAHGLPQKVIDKGDPYQKQLQTQVSLLTDIFRNKGVFFESINLAYQSKVGPMKWLEPSLDDELTKYKDKKVIIYPISFIIDNSETDFELKIEYKEIADEIGLEEYRVCKCLNDSDKFVDTIIKLIN